MFQGESELCDATCPHGRTGLGPREESRGVAGVQRRERVRAGSPEEENFWQEEQGLSGSRTKRDSENVASSKERERQPPGARIVQFALNIKAHDIKDDGMEDNLCFVIKTIKA